MRKEKQLKSCCKKMLSSPNVSIGDLQRTRRFVMKQQTTCVEDSRVLAGRANSGMTGLFYHGNNAFTLIELLVVVLIIGVLAAVALPQYQKVVDKSRFSTLLPLVKAIANAKSEHYLATGERARRFDVLIVELAPGFVVEDDDTYGQSATLEAKKINLYVDSVAHKALGTLTLSDNSKIWLFIAGEGSTSSENICEGDPVNKRAGELCKSIPGATKTNSDRDRYAIP